MINGCQGTVSGDHEEVEKGLIKGCGQVSKMFVSGSNEIDGRRYHLEWLLETVEKQGSDILSTHNILTRGKNPFKIFNALLGQ